MANLYYTNPASEWEQALPIGNGRLGGMIYGGVEKELIQVNEENMWLGGYSDRVNPNARANLQKVREYMSCGEVEKAERLLDVAFSGCPDGMSTYQTLGEIQILFDGFGKASQRKSAKVGKLGIPEGVTGYSRTLDLDKAVCAVSFEYEGTKYRREYFASYPRGCIVMRFISEGDGDVSFNVRLRRGKCFDGVKKSGSGILLYGNLGRGGRDFAMKLCCKADGKVQVIGESLCVSCAKEAVLYITAVTDKYCSRSEKEAYVKNYIAHNPAVPQYYQDALCDYERTEYLTHSAILHLLEEKLNDIICAASAAPYTHLLQEHIKDYKSLYAKCSLHLDGQDGNLPTDIRLEKFKENHGDNYILNLLFDYGRYLTVACSRKGGLPATLQGLWNKEFFPPWDSKYTININTEMNYWHVEMCNLSDCHMPLFDLLEKVRVTGRRTARKMYGCRGFVAHHNTDVNGDSAPQDTWYAGTYWVMGGAWLSTHLWEHYRYTLDKQFLNKAFPVMAEAALFFVDFLTEEDGWLVTSPSVSPENSYIGEDGNAHCCCISSAMDNQILSALFSDCIKAWEALGRTAPDDMIIEGVDDIPALMEEIACCNAKLKPVQVGSDGRIMEWNKEFKEAEAGHRHLSHLFAVYPGGSITPCDTPKLALAAEKTIDARLSSGSGYTGWSRAWIINLYVSLYKGEKAFENLCDFVSYSVYPNLFDKHPPFQIDGNFGICAAICRMIAQSSEGKLYLLPALPEKWQSGKMEGICVVGNARLSIEWACGKLKRAEVAALSPYAADVCYNGCKRYIALNIGERIVLEITDFSK